MTLLFMMNTVSPQVHHLSWLNLILSTPSLYKLANAPELAIEVHLISVGCTFDSFSQACLHASFQQSCIGWP